MPTRKATVSVGISLDLTTTPTCRPRLVHWNCVSGRGPSERLTLSDILFGKGLTRSAETQAKSAMLIGGLYPSKGTVEATGDVGS